MQLAARFTSTLGVGSTARCALWGVRCAWYDAVIVVGRARADIYIVDSR